MYDFSKEIKFFDITNFFFKIKKYGYKVLKITSLCHLEIIYIFGDIVT